MNKHTSTFLYVINNTIHFLVVLLVFFTPLVFTSNTNELYEFPKTFFVYILGATVIFLFIVEDIIKIGALKAPPIYITAFIISYTISTLFSSHLYTSVWGYYSRFNGGLLSILILFGLYLVIVNLFSKVDFENIFFILALTIIPISFYSIYQYFEGIIRVYSTFGQPNWLAAYVVMIIPLVFDHYLKCQKSFIKDFLWFLLFVIGFASLWFSSSISGLLGFFGCFVLYFFLNSSLIKVNKQKVAVAVIACLIIIFSFSSFILKRAEGILHDISESGWVYAETIPVKHNISDPGVIRFGMWKSTVDLIFSSPRIFLIGTGPETFPYVFQKFRDSLLNYSSEWDYILNKPHNYYLEVFSEKGIMGLLSYLYIVFYTLKSKHSFLAPALLGFYITNIFSWPTVSTALVFWIMLAYLTVKE